MFSVSVGNTFKIVIQGDAWDSVKQYSGPSHLQFAVGVILASQKLRPHSDVFCGFFTFQMGGKAACTNLYMNIIITNYNIL